MISPRPKPSFSRHCGWNLVSRPRITTWASCGSTRDVGPRPRQRIAGRSNWRRSTRRPTPTSACSCYYKAITGEAGPSTNGGGGSHRPRGPSSSNPAGTGHHWLGRTILLYAEEGLGDTLQFVRLTSLVRGHAGRVIVKCLPALCELVSTVPGIDQVVAAGQTLPSFDVQAPLLAIPAILGLTPETIPCRVPYLATDARRVDHWRERLSTEPGFKVGIVWQGRTTFHFDVWRSIPLEHFAPLAAVPGVRLYSLQKGPGSEQLASEQRVAAGHTFAVTNLGRELDNGGSAFVDTAAVLKNLDLVITSDTATAHLAGALGVPTWVALPLAPDWRWLLDRDDSPWYPSLRLFRQTQRRGWPAVFARMAVALTDAVANRQPSARGQGAPLRVS